MGRYLGFPAKPQQLVSFNWRYPPRDERLVARAEPSVWDAAHECTSGESLCVPAPEILCFFGTVTPSVASAAGRAAHAAQPLQAEASWELEVR